MLIPGLWLRLHTAIGYGALSILFVGRGLHSFTFQLNISAFCAIGCAFRDCLGVV